MAEETLDDQTNVVKLKLVAVSDNFLVAPDEVLEHQKGKLQEVLLIGVQDGELIVACSHGQEHALWLTERAKKEYLV